MHHKKGNSIFKKISLVFTIVVIVALIAFGTLVYGLVNNIYKKELIQNYKNIADDIVVQTEVKLSSVEELASMICSDSNLQSLVREHLKYEDYEIDLNKRVVIYNEKELNLTTLEFDLLILFLENKNKSLNRELIIEKIWGNGYYGSDRVVDDLVRRLRKKMNKLNISTIYGYGYRLS